MFNRFCLIAVFFGSLALEQVGLSQQTLTKKFSNFDLSGQSIEAEVCDHSSFDNGTAKAASFQFFRVMRFCNFNAVIADAATFRGPMYQQYFRNSSLQDTKFYLGRVENQVPSRVYFEDSDLTNAAFFGDVSGIQFKNTILDGVTINGLPCQQLLPACQAASWDE